jgi:hypothetical protein
MKYVITYHDDNNILQRYTQTEYNSISEAESTIEYYKAMKYEYAKFLNVMPSDVFFNKLKV